MPSSLNETGVTFSDGTAQSTAAVTSPPGSMLVLGTALASTSGTSIDFAGIPSWVKRVTVMLSGVSTNGTSPVRLQTGAGSVQTTGYLGYNLQYSNTTIAGANISSGFDLSVATGESAAATRHGSVVFTNISSNTWTVVGCLGLSNNIFGSTVAGSIALSGTLDRVRVTTVGGTDTFDAGTINILYE